nr:MAG TPA: hypothetical protein [Caudoviricetes sp.]DAZ12548.1 MAG TPA: hypothetical protein [Caudoviricetes sp.]
MTETETAPLVAQLLFCGGIGRQCYFGRYAGGLFFMPQRINLPLLVDSSCVLLS